MSIRTLQPCIRARTWAATLRPLVSGRLVVVFGAFGTFVQNSVEDNPGPGLLVLMLCHTVLAFVEVNCRYRI